MKGGISLAYLASKYNIHYGKDHNKATQEVQ